MVGGVLAAPAAEILKGGCAKGQRITAHWPGISARTRVKQMVAQNSDSPGSLWIMGPSGILKLLKSVFVAGIFVGCPCQRAQRPGREARMVGRLGSVGRERHRVGCRHVARGKPRSLSLCPLLKLTFKQTLQTQRSSIGVKKQHIPTELTWFPIF